MQKQFWILIYLGSIILLLNGCASTGVTYRQFKELSPQSIGAFGKKEALDKKLTITEDTPKEEQWQQWRCNGPVAFEVSVYPLATFDGEKFELFRVDYNVDEVCKLMSQAGFSEYYYNRLKIGAENFSI